jgi:hypothetical protein
MITKQGLIATGISQGKLLAKLVCSHVDHNIAVSVPVHKSRLTLDINASESA